ncbi:deleted in azoospermia-like isoform 1-T1 [Synchiropus picturatus]
MDYHVLQNSHHYPSKELPNGFILPEGKITPNAIFVGGLGIEVDEREVKEFFKQYGAIKDVKIITNSGGSCKGYGFVYFEEDVDIDSIVEQQMRFNGRRLKLGPAIMKKRQHVSRFMASNVMGSSLWVRTPQCVYWPWCPPPMPAPMPLYPPVVDGLCNQAYQYGDYMTPQFPVGYVPAPNFQEDPGYYAANRPPAFQTYVDSEVQTLVTALSSQLRRTLNENGELRYF